MTDPAPPRDPEAAAAGDVASPEGASPSEQLAAGFPDATFTTSAGQDVVFVAPENYGEFVAAARRAGFEMFADLTAVDYLDRQPRFDVVVNVLSVDPPARLRIRVEVPDGDARIPSITGVYPGANFFEREVYDLFGIRFTGHPDLTRILLPDDWEGHPLRKDYPVGSVPVQFRDAPRAH